MLILDLFVLLDTNDRNEYSSSYIVGIVPVLCRYINIILYSDKTTELLLTITVYLVCHIYASEYNIYEY